MKALHCHGSGDVRLDSVALANAPEAYKSFRDKKDGCIKVVLKP